MDSLALDPSGALACVLVWTRLGALLGLSPVAQAVKAPPSFWVLFTLAMAGCLTVAMHLSAPMPASVAGLALMMASEAALGALMGLALHAAFAAFAMAGRLIDLQMGLGMGAILDPVSRSNTPMLGATISLLGLVVFFAADAHHALLRGVARSLDWVPPGAPWRLPDAAQLLVLVAGVFSVAIVVVAPALFMLLLLEAVLSLASRVLPQMNVLFVGMPVKTLLGLIMLALAAPGMLPVMQKSYRGIFSFWQGVLS